MLLERNRECTVVEDEEGPGKATSQHPDAALVTPAVLTPAWAGGSRMSPPSSHQPGALCRDQTQRSVLVAAGNGFIYTKTL